MKRIGLVALALIAMLGAQPVQAGGPFAKESVPARSSRKFLRGVQNVAFFWAEIPKEIHRDWKNVDPFTGLFTGTGKGLYKGGMRLGVGVFEVVTFPLDVPANYQPIIYPETVFEDGFDWNAEEYHAMRRTSEIKY
jgi:putative exosortase-associated protein (TIGR04073 family)